MSITRKLRTQIKMKTNFTDKLITFYLMTQKLISWKATWDFKTQLMYIHIHYNTTEYKYKK